MLSGWIVELELSNSHSVVFALRSLLIMADVAYQRNLSILQVVTDHVEHLSADNDVLMEVLA